MSLGAFGAGAAGGAATALFFDVFARDRTKDTFSKIASSTDTLGGKIARFGKLASGVAVAGAVAFATQGVRSFLRFDDAMTQSLAIMGNVSGPMRKQMEDAARAVGRTTRFSADEAAQGYFYLASAGMDAEQAVAAMPQVAKFAQAGMFDLARATDLATDAQSALGMSVKDPEQNLRNLTRVTDTLVGANTLANASVEQFSTALTSKAGPAMRQANMEIEEGVAVLAVWADQGLKGEAAGTRFSATLEGLQRNAINNRDAFDDLGISVFDADGSMRHMADIVADLEGALGHMSVEQQKAALMQLGFNRQALDGVVSLLGLSDQIRTYESDLQHMGGITEEVADNQLQSFAAKLDLIKSRVTDWGLGVGEVLVTTAFTVGETVGEMARIFGELPDAVGIGIGAVLGISAAAPIAIGAFRRIKSAVETLYLTYLTMSRGAQAATLSLGIVGVALAVGTGVLAYFARRNIEARQRVDELRQSLERQTGAITDNTREIAAKELQDRGALDMASAYGLALDTVTDAALGNADAQKVVADRIAELRQEMHDQREAGELSETQFFDLRDELNKFESVLSDSNDTLSQAQKEHQQLAEAAGDGADAQDDLEAAVASATDVVEEQTDALNELIRELNDMVSAAFSARDASRGFEQALDDATESVKENGATLDITTEKGRRNEQQLDRLAEAALKDAAATLEDAEAKGELARGHEEATAKMEVAREAFIDVAEQMGMSRDAAEELADELGLIPGNYVAQIDAETSEAEARVRGLAALVAEATRSRTFTINANVSAAMAAANRLNANIYDRQQRARGGPVWPGEQFLVGEHGPEIVRFSRSGSMSDAPSTSRQLARGGDGASANGDLNTDALQQRIARAIEDGNRSTVAELRELRAEVAGLVAR